MNSFPIPVQNTQSCPHNGVCPYVERLKKCMELYQKQQGGNFGGPTNHRTPGYSQSDQVTNYLGRGNSSRADNKIETQCAEFLKYVNQTIKEELGKRLPKDGLDASHKRGGKGKGKRERKKESDDALKADTISVLSRELRASILYIGCDCEKRNGLQDSCPRRSCQGSPACLTVPPTCGPSRYSNGKHLEKKLIRRKGFKALR